jgi:hypothetical protein
LEFLRPYVGDSPVTLVCYNAVMDKEKLLIRQKEIEARFENARSQRDKLSDELVRIQGEYRAVTDLIKELNQGVQDGNGQKPSTKTK